MVGKDKARVYITVEKNFLALLRKIASESETTLSETIIYLVKWAMNKK